MPEVDMRADVRHERLPDWAGRGARLCRNCGRIFNGMTSFDAHHTEHYDRKPGEGPLVECRLDSQHWWNGKRGAWSHGIYTGPGSRHHV